jgi:hypothetical protein
MILSLKWKVIYNESKRGDEVHIFSIGVDPRVIEDNKRLKLCVRNS